MNNEANTYTTGVFTINDKILSIRGKIINISKISSIEFITYKRHSLFFGLKNWLSGLVIMFIIAAIWRKLEIVFILYLFSIVLLFVYNYVEHKKVFYGLEIHINNEIFWLKSDNKDFITKVNKALVDSINSKNANYVINMDNRVLNNGIINKGNNNKNKVGKKK